VSFVIVDCQKKNLGLNFYLVPAPHGFFSKSVLNKFLNTATPTISIRSTKAILVGDTTF